MKKLCLSAAMLTTLALSGCAATGTGGATNNGVGNGVGTATNIGMNVFKVAVDNQCRVELEKQRTWRIASAAMTAQQKMALEDKVCGCVSEQAPQQVTIVDMANAAIDSQYRTQLVTRVVARSLQSCYGSILK